MATSGYTRFVVRGVRCGRPATSKEARDIWGADAAPTVNFVIWAVTALGRSVKSGFSSSVSAHCGAPECKHRGGQCQTCLHVSACARVGRRFAASPVRPERPPINNHTMAGEIKTDAREDRLQGPMRALHKEREHVRKQMLKDARDQCHETRAAYVECAKGRTLSLPFMCRTDFKAFNACLSQFSSDEELERRIAEYKRVLGSSSRTRRQCRRCGRAT